MWRDKLIKHAFDAASKNRNNVNLRMLREFTSNACVGRLCFYTFLKNITYEMCECTDN